MPLTTEQKKLYLDLENAIEKKEDITDLLKQVEKNDLIEVFATCGTKVKYINSGKKEDTESMNLIEYAAGIGNMEGLKAIFNYCKKNSISAANLLKSLKSDVDLSSSAELREIQFDEREIFLKILNRLKEVGSLKEFLSAKEESPIFKSLPTAHYESIFECLNESEDDKIDVGLLVNKLSDKGILKEVISIMKGDLLEIEKLKNELKCSNNYDALGKIYRAEKEIAANKAMKVGSVCGVIAALALVVDVLLLVLHYQYWL